MAYNSKRQVSLKIVQAVLKSKRKLDNDNIIDQLTGFIQPLMEPDKEADAQIQAYEFEDE